MRRRIARLMRGVTLIELVVAITVLAIAVTSIIGFLSSIAARSADTLVREQAVAIASSYLNEVLAKPFVSTRRLTTCQFHRRRRLQRAGRQRRT